MTEEILRVLERLYSLTFFGLFVTAGGAYRAYLSSISHNELRKRIDARNKKLDREPSIISKILWAAYYIVLYIVYFSFIIIGFIVYNKIEFYVFIMNLSISSLFITGLTLNIIFADKIDFLQKRYEKNNWRSNDINTTRDHISKTAFIFIVIGTMMQMIGYVIN